MSFFESQSLMTYDKAYLCLTLDLSVQLQTRSIAAEGLGLGWEHRGKSSRWELSTAKFSMTKLRMGVHAKRWMGQKALVDCHVNSQGPKCNLDCHTEARNHSTFELRSQR